MKPIAFVIPWYGDDIRGGAEQACNYLAHILSNAGISVEVLTTCVREASDDRGINTLEHGLFFESGVPVRRFPVRKRDVDAFTRANLKIYNNEPFDIEDEKIYFREDINSPDMYRFIQDHKDFYHCFVFIPYMYGPIYNGMLECMEKAYLIPCLHDESYAYMSMVKKCIESFKGLIFLSKPESELAHKLYCLDGIKTNILGGGIDTDWVDQCDPQAFRNKYNIYDNFILFAGRKDAGKKADELVLFFTMYKKIHNDVDIKLVLLGGGTLQIPEDCKKDVLDLGFVPVEDKRNAFSAATIFCNPSQFESFSIVIMESWLAKRPVLVSEKCAVTTNFCLESNGGLFYQNYAEFEACVNYLLKNHNIADQMGQNGFKYVIERFSHDVIVKKYLQFFDMQIG
jgi:glycosyltransferase involved in cell wall biosynthesis